jgi:hypothetical protein
MPFAEWAESAGQFGIALTGNIPCDDCVERNSHRSAEAAADPLRGISSTCPRRRRTSQHKTRAIFARWSANQAHRLPPSKRAEQVKFQLQQIEQRLGQHDFRIDVMRAFKGRCAITGRKNLLSLRRRT